ncbi:MAG: glycosyltransferase family 4 protein [Bacteriovoracaceae bacterium]
MKVLISRKDLRDTASGVPKKVLQEVSLFKKLGFTPYAIAETMNEPMIREFQGTPVKTIRWPISGYFRRRFYQMQVDRWIKKNRPNIVIGHGDILHQDVLYIHNCVHLAHELIEKKPLPQDHEVGRIHSQILTKGTFKLLVCNSEMMKNDLVKRFNLDSSKAVVIYPEVNLQKFEAADPKALKKEWRSKLGIPQDAFVFGIVTSGNYKKRNLGMLIEAFKEVSKKHSNVHLFVGGGNVDQKFKDMISEKVTFAPTLMDVKNYFYLLDAFALPAHIEEFGRSVLEAMFCGIPAITTETVGCSEIIEGKGRELILTSITKEELVQKMERLFDESFYREVKSLNRETAKKYSADSQNEKLEEVLKRYRILYKS